MPRIKRWFPVSHDINGDPEVIAYTDKFGLAGLKVWLECLSIGDRNEGILGTDLQTLARSLAIKCNSTQSRVRLMLDWTLTQSWIDRDSTVTQSWMDRDSTIRLRNYLKYHRTPEHKPAPSEPDLSEPDLKPPIAPQATSSQFDEFWASYPRKVGKGAAEKAWKKIKGGRAVGEKIIAAVKLQKGSSSWNRDGGQYIPHPATWLNQKRWLDDVEKFSNGEDQEVESLWQPIEMRAYKKAE